MNTIESLPVVQHVRQTLRDTLAHATPGAHAFFQALAVIPPEQSTADVFLRSLGCHPTTIISRFFRAGVPSPKAYIAAMRVVHWCALLDDDTMTMEAAAHTLRYSSSGAVCRHLRERFGVPPSVLRAKYSGEAMADHFLATMVTPYAETWRHFDPFETTYVARVRSAKALYRVAA